MNARKLHQMTIEESLESLAGKSPQVSEPKDENAFEVAESRTLLDQLLTDSQLYRSSDDFQKLLDFTVRLRNFAPFNAMLLQIQKPGMRYAASAHDWLVKFGRRAKEDARPLLILWPFGPVALVYDVLDTEGDDLPEDVDTFFASGEITKEKLASFWPLLEKKNIKPCEIDAGDTKAGSIHVVKRATWDKEVSQYKMKVNRNHPTATQFTTVAHELGHLFLGHLGFDKKLKIPKRVAMSHPQVELEAESVAYLVCKRNGVAPKSETYLTNFVTKEMTIEDLDLYQIMRAAGQVETLLGLVSCTKYHGTLASKV